MAREGFTSTYLSICTENSIDPVLTIVPDDAIMTPVEAKDAAAIAAFE